MGREAFLSATKVRIWGLRRSGSGDGEGGKGSDGIGIARVVGRPGCRRWLREVALRRADRSAPVRRGAGSRRGDAALRPLLVASLLEAPRGSQGPQARSKVCR
ncbi:hypothetical protein B296_00048611 [Ensete ventricosum]|uniref:Uncharacterized protein n=1 Tax=Ensete ventricosum TaxID=4639 RepID=A0A426YU40_ENSVE|nr:hypothetical protein B296_00048611 [Ensete ventricosum]